MRRVVIACWWALLPFVLPLVCAGYLAVLSGHLGAMTELPFHAKAGFFFVLGFAGSHVIEKFEAACRVFGDRWRSI